jgi:hypothetical protein
MDLAFLRSLYGETAGAGEPGYVSVYLDTTPADGSARAELALRWRDARRRLVADGADEPTLDVIGHAVTAREHGIGGHAAFARAGSLLLSRPLPEPPRREISRYAPLPHVMPLLAQQPRNVPHVRIAASHVGGQVLAFSGEGMASTEGTADPDSGGGSVPVASGAESVSATPAELSEVRGEAWPVHKVRTGGEWAQAHLQRSVEETWAHNAREIAEVAVREAARVRAEFVVVGGDVRERSMVADLLPPSLRETAVLVDREVAADSAEFARAAQAEAARLGLEASRDRLGEFRERMSRTGAGTGRAAEGLDATLTALRDGLAAGVLIDDDPSSAALAWIGPGLADAATRPEQLAELGIGTPVRDRADAALARAAAGTGTALFFLPPGSGLRDGVGALLRGPVPGATA